MSDMAGLQNSSSDAFLKGLVFGFDVGTASIGYAVRRGKEFLDVGVLICPEDTNDLSKRRELRRQRRTLRSRKYRRQWFAKELEKLGLPRPRNPLHDPITLRLRALDGEELKPEELYSALTHLFKRRGYSKVPWAKEEQVEKKASLSKKNDEEGKIKEAVKKIKGKLGDLHPCQFLSKQCGVVGKSPKGKWARNIYWPREALKNEFLAIVEAQKERVPKLAEKAEWLLHGNTQEIKSHHVFFKASEARDPGILGLRWPRFDNRNPGLDLLRPLDELDRPLHVVRRNKQVFRETQFEQAIFNFRVIDKGTGKKIIPDIISLNRLRQIYELAKRNPKTKDLKISESVLKTWSKELADKYELMEDQQELVSRSGDGRAKFCSATLRDIKQVLERLSAGQTMEAIQPLLRMSNESKDQAMARFLGGIRHGLVRHRLNLFLRLFRRLIKDHGKPNFIVMEAVRSLAFSKLKKDAYKEELKKNRNTREEIFQKLKSEKKSTSKNALLRYQLAKEAGFECPFCLKQFDQADLFNGNVDISHLYPKSLTPCKEFYNLTISHIHCNRTDMEAKIPREAFGSDPLWPKIETNARKRFVGKKLELCLAQTRDDAEKLIESKASLAATAYISKMIRRLCLIDLEWQGNDGRDPTDKEGNIPSRRFLVTNGEITARCREGWKLNEILHESIPAFTDDEWQNLTAEQRQAYKEAKKKRFEKNRGDHRHHALDAMVVACTWPAYAQRVHNATKEWQEKGWWYFDAIKKRLIARHPLFQNFEPMKSAVTEWMNRLISESRVNHHASKSKHGQAYKTSFFSRRPDKKNGGHFYLMRENLLDISPKDLRLGKVHPPEFSLYLYTAWDGYLGKLYSYIEKAAVGFLKTLNEDTNVKLIAKQFGSRLDWSDFRAWLQRETQEPALAVNEANERIVLNSKAVPEFKKDQTCEWIVKMPEPEKLLKTMPEDFQRRLCFSHYQQWLQDREVGFRFPDRVIIPITRVRYRQPVNDNSVAIGPKSIPGWNAGHVYVKRAKIQEVWLMPHLKEAGVVPVFVPYAKRDKPYSNYEFVRDAMPVMVLRKQCIVRFVKDYSSTYMSGNYVVLVLGESVVKFTLPYVVNTKEALMANGLPKSGLQAKWHLLIPALGFEFPKNIAVAEQVAEEQEDEGQDDT